MNSPNNSTASKSPFLAEAVFASFVEGGYMPANIKTFNKGGFKKSYSNDVEDISAVQLGDHAGVALMLNRDGIYDILPEGLFHQTRGSNKVSTVDDAVIEHKQFKEEERQARMFFGPIEQLIFQYRGATETAERDALYDMQNGRLTRAFYHFWNISENLPAAPATRLLQLMPHRCSIKGSAQATAIALSHVLGKTVTINTTHSPDPYQMQQKNLNAMQLGLDAVTGASSADITNCWACEVHNIAHQELSLYVNNQPMKNVIDRFVEIFFPMDIEASFDFFLKYLDT